VPAHPLGMVTATALLAAVKAALVALYPAIRVEILRRPIEGGRADAEAIEGYKPPLLIVSMSEDEEVDGVGGFEEVSMSYPVRIDYLTVTAPGQDKWRDDPDVRAKRKEIRQALYKLPLGGLTLTDVTTAARNPADPLRGGTFNGSGWTFHFLDYEPRPS